MCTALSFQAKEGYFGRNLDLDCSYGEEVCVMPRNFSVKFRKMGEWKSHFALIGMATVVDGIPLYYDAVNEFGLAMAGLNFPANAYYPPYMAGKDNVTPFELIPWILGQCKSVTEAKKLLEKINLVNLPFSEELPLSPLHFMIADKTQSIVVEPMKEGLKVHQNPVGVLTNNPPFEYHLLNLNNYRNLTADNGKSEFGGIPLESFCLGLGAVGLPGDVSSPSRFVRMAFHRANATKAEKEERAVAQFFHLLSSVEMIEGCCITQSGKYDLTGYSSCMNTDRGLYYYTTYYNRQIHCIDMHKVDLDGNAITRYPLILEGGIVSQN